MLLYPYFEWLTLLLDTCANNTIRFHSDEVKVIYSAAEPYIQLNATHCSRSKSGLLLGAEKRNAILQSQIQRI